MFIVHWLIILGTVLHLGAFAISFINLPFDATIGDTSNEAIMHSDPKLAIFASFLLGSGAAITRCVTKYSSELF